MVKPGAKVDLRRVDAASTAGLKGGRGAAMAALEPHSEQLAALQDRLWAEAKHPLLVILQGIDASGKDGTIKHVFRGVNPQGTRVTSFKEPTAEELTHDFLWRVHLAVPRAGEIGIFNRSQYEDVLIARVRRLVPARVWKPRFAQIADFERTLVASGTTLVKLCLLISKDEQRRRFEERLTTPSKRWKFRRSDLEDRARWDDYRVAYGEAIEKTATDVTPWYVIPADHKWYRNWAVSTILIETLQEMNPQYPDPPDLRGVRIT
ncbi:MAG: polyphosphate kinase 2 family protein [Chloroflexi bacterium]|nr:MAG: polyphosphate kinase 2 family protein [Chloroflexota bacterium]TMF15298.1 MAG: polyphosphate kinase 2 family protein [Chloroflexota bacterium]